MGREPRPFCSRPIFCASRTRNPSRGPILRSARTETLATQATVDSVFVHVNQNSTSSTPVFKALKHGAILYNEAEVFSLSITNPMDYKTTN